MHDLEFFLRCHNRVVDTSLTTSASIRCSKAMI